MRAATATAASLLASQDELQQLHGMAMRAVHNPQHSEIRQLALALAIAAHEASLMLCGALLTEMPAANDAGPTAA